MKSISAYFKEDQWKNGRLAGRLVLAGAVLLFLFGLLVSGDYGQHCDQNNQFTLLRANEKEYALHLSEGGMKDELLNYFEERGVVEISKSENLDHGIAAYYPAAFVLLLDNVSHRLMVDLWNAYTFCLFFLGVVSLYFIGKELFDSRLTGCAMSLFLYLTPRMFAEGHYNNKDVVMLSLMLVSVWMGLLFVKRRSFCYAALMGTAAAFAANIKIAGAWGLGIVGFFYLLELTQQRKWSRRAFFAGFTAVAAFLFVYYVITPACWNDPAGFLQYLTGNAKHFTRWDDDILFNGMLYRHSRNPLPKLYLFRMLGMTVPIYILALAVFGQGALVYRLVRQRKSFFRESGNVFLLFLSFMWLLPLAYACASGMLVYNSWRHFYFCYGPILILAGYGVDRLVSLKRPERLRYAAGAAVGVCLLGSGIFLIKEHPHQYAYFNALAGRDAGRRYEIDYWVIGGREILEKLYDSPDRDRSLELSIGACDITTDIGMGNGLFNLYKDEMEAFVYREDWREANYVVVNSTYSRIEELRGNTDARTVKENYRKVCSISAYGNELWSVYERNAE